MVTQTHLWGYLKKSVPFLAKKIIQVPYLFLGLFSQFIFSSFRVLLKTVSVIQMASVAYEILLFGSGLMNWAISASGVTSVI